MDATLIVVIIFIVVFCIGGPILGHYASVKSHKSDRADEYNSKEK